MQIASFEVAIVNVHRFMQGKKERIALLVACGLIGCGKASPPSEVRSTSTGVVSTATQEISDGAKEIDPEILTSIQLPDIKYWVKAGEGHFEDYGVRDVTAPNMMLSQWNCANAPQATPLQPATAKAMEEDTALALDLHNVQLTPHLKKQLSKLTHLQWLSLSLGVTGSDLNWLGEMKSLRGLALTHANLDKSAFEGLGKAKGLQFLTLSNSKFTESDFAEFPKLEKLETLRLEGKQVSDQCALRLAKLRLPALRSLGLDLTSITDSGLQSLCDVYDFEWLNLYCSRNISEQSVANLGRMQRLHLIGVGGTGISPRFQRTEAVSALQRLLPNCRVDFGD